MSGVIGDDTGKLSIAPTTRKLHDDTEQESLDYTGRTLTDENDVVAMGWRADDTTSGYKMFDPGGNLSHDWYNRLLVSSGQTRIDYANNILNGGNPVKWRVDNGDFEVDTAGSGYVYRHQGNAGISDTANGISGGIVIDKNNLLSGTIVTNHILNLAAQGF
jgi:hypothetical protein